MLLFKLVKITFVFFEKKVLVFYSYPAYEFLVVLIYAPITHSTLSLLFVVGFV